MRNRWAEDFLELAKSKGVGHSLIRSTNGWPETVRIAGRTCFVKSKTYDGKEYFIGVDPGKFDDDGDAVVVCGGDRGSLRDIFVISWDTFFSAMAQAEPVNTFKRKTPYLQFKVHIRNHDDSWVAEFQGGVKPELDVTTWRHDPIPALEAIEDIPIA